METKAPELCRDLPAATYHARAGASASRLSEMLISPAHAYRSMTCRGKTTAALKRGSAFHCNILTPDLFDSQFDINQDRKTSPDDERTLGANDYEAVLGMSESILAHKVAAELLADREARELSAFWWDEETGVLCKNRFDHVCKTRSIILDLKTTADASPAAFRRSIVKYGYHRQGSLYLRGASACEIPKDYFVIIAVENEARIIIDGKLSHAVACYVLDADAIEQGGKENARLLREWKRCEETNNWPSYPEEIIDLGLPAWAFKEGEENE